jgi:hypothetical protein
MTPQMQEALYRISLCFDPDPNAVFQRIVEELSSCYGHTMAMINLVADDCMRSRAVVNLHPALTGIESLELRNTY